MPAENSVFTAQQGRTRDRQRSPEEGLIIESREKTVEAPPEVLFRVVEGLGGKRGWLYADFPWKVRDFLDRLVGGIGMRRGRRHPDELRPGDALDFWRVEVVEKGRRILLGAEMRVPGQAWLELQVHPGESGGSILRMRAIFDPRGLMGLLYWYLLYPFHKIIFSGMAGAIRCRAEKAAGG